MILIMIMIARAPQNTYHDQKKKRHRRGDTEEDEEDRRKKAGVLLPRPTRLYAFSKVT
jgi:hypothetical protein